MRLREHRTQCSRTVAGSFGLAFSEAGTMIKLTNALGGLSVLPS